MRVAFDVEQHQRRPIPRRQLSQGRLQAFPQDNPLRFGVGERIVVRDLFVQTARHPHPTPAAAVDRRIRHDPHQPRPEPAGAVELVELHEREEQRILRRVVRVIDVAEDGAGDAAQRPHIRSHELSQCFVIARQDARHERGLFLRGPRLSRPPRWAVQVGGEGRHGSHGGEYGRGGVGADAMMNSDQRREYTKGTLTPKEHRMRFAFAGSVGAVLLAACPPPSGGFRQSPGGVDPVATRYINPGTLAAIPGFTHAVRVGATVYVSGEVALDSLGRLVGPGDLKAQAAQAFANLATVLRIAGVGPADVAKLTVYVVSAKPGDLELIRAAAPDFFPERNPPAGTVVGVATLPRDGLLIAVDATAVVRAMFRPLDERDRRSRP